ncbi:MAG: zinc metalloprotease HtpX [Chloroflexota bacterium]
MRRKWYGGDSGLTVRMFVTLFLLAAVYIAFLVVLWQVGVGFLPLVFFAALLLGVQYYFSDRLVLWTIGAKTVSPSDAPELYEMIGRLSALADLPSPKVAIINSQIPNAFATGRSPSSAVIAVTTGLMDRLERPELEAVLAHELSHVKNRDVVVMTIASFLSTVAFLLIRSYFFFGAGYGQRRDRGGGALVIVYLVSLLVWVISFILIRFLSRYREYAADRAGAILTGAPSQLGSALLKISGVMQRIPQRDLREVEALNAFFIIPTLKGSVITELFSTHPSLENRLAALKRLEQEMEGR